MLDISRLSDAHAILLACEVCAAGNVAPLPRLQRQFPTSLTPERLYRIILTFLPESTPPQQYILTLQSLSEGSGPNSDSHEVDASSIKDLSDPVARKKVRRLGLLPLQYPHAEEWTINADSLTQFIIHRAHRIDAESGLQMQILDLLLPFYERSDVLRTWLVSRLLPLLRSNYEYYPSREEALSMHIMESMDRATAINVLLSMSDPDTAQTDLARNLRGLVGPWMSGEARNKRRKLNPHTDSAESSMDVEVHPDEKESSSWQEVNEWLLSRSLVDYGAVVDAFVRWDGPEDIDLGGYEREEDHNDGEKSLLKKSYGQTGLAVVYAADPTRSSLEGSFQITSKVAALLHIDPGLDLKFDSLTLPALNLDLDTISKASRASLLQNNLLGPSNLLTVPTTQSIAFLQAVLVSLRILREVGYQTSSRAATTMCLQSSDEAQSLELRGVVNAIVSQAKPGRDWSRIREQILWLRDWRGTSPNSQTDPRREYHGLFWRMSREMAETHILKAMLDVGEYQLAATIYTVDDSPLGSTQVERAVAETIITFFDNASNGNKTRGKMKKALEILRAFQCHFPNSKSLQEINALILATHALSFYSLTLQHGVPFQPVSIRVHLDPLSLIEKVLEQNPKSYTKLDDLLFIGQNFVAAGLPMPSASEDHHLDGDTPPPSRDEASVTAEKRIISMAVSSALSSNDFGTAYSYILTRLTPPSLLPQAASSSSTSPIHDDISWRAAYNAGRHRSSAAAAESSPHSRSLHTQIANLSQRMELLSLALILAPSPDPLIEVLGAWRRCDEEMTGLRSRESQEAEEWDRRGDDHRTAATLSTVPGGFGPTDRELDAFENEHEHEQRTRRARARHHHHDGTTSYGDAPMGLFDVARGAARAFSKNAFPLHSSTLSLGSASQRNDGTRTSEDMARSSDAASDGETTGPRVRKRDMVSNMVTGGLASGIGWVLGAQAVNERS